MEKLAIFLIIIYIIIYTILYRLQRRTRDFSRATRAIGARMPLFIFIQNRTHYQINSIILIINYILLIGISVLIFIIFNWLWLLIFLFYIFIVTPIIQELFKKSKDKK